MTSSKLCPFCKSDCLRVRPSVGHRLGQPLFCMTCLACEACGPAARTETLAVQAWNSRCASDYRRIRPLDPICILEEAPS